KGAIFSSPSRSEWQGEEARRQPEASNPCLSIHQTSFPFALASGHGCQPVGAREILRWLLPLLHTLNLHSITRRRPARMEPTTNLAFPSGTRRRCHDFAIAVPSGEQRNQRLVPVSEQSTGGVVVGPSSIPR
uniref:Uncharacterized protein n=1 Tax=Triticum urartu TaxID=4572 RepID=A0A8R7TTD7_TRIUA